MDPNRTALLLMDFQLGIADGANAAGSVQMALRAREFATSVGTKVIFCKVGFQEGYPEVADSTPIFSGAKKHGMFTGKRSALLEQFKPAADEPIIDKKRVSAFAGSSLEIVLRAHDVRSLVLTGISTSGVVLSTLRQAFDLDYAMTVLSDACFDVDQNVHDLLMTKVFPRQAAVLTVSDWIAKVRS
jgi:nicotinamidase-related amidase